MRGSTRGCAVPAPLLEIRDLRVSFRTATGVVRAVDGLSLVVDTGDVLLRGLSLMKLGSRDMRAVRGAEIAMIFQDPMTALTPVYTVGWQIAEQLRAHEELTKKQARKRTVELLAEVGI